MGTKNRKPMPTGTKSLDVYFDPPVLFVLLALTLHNQESCGVTWSCDTEMTCGSSPITSVHLKSDTSSSPVTSKKTLDALSTGLKVSLHEWKQLNEIASQFLMSEEILDGS